MEITNVEVAFLEFSKQGAGMPMSTTGDPKTPKIIDKLGKAKSGSGHDCFLKGIRVGFDLEATQYEWMQIERYTFFDIVSSQSKMHKLMEMNLAEQLNDGVTQLAIDNLINCMTQFEEGKITYDDLMDNVPCGLKLKARCNASYMQLKTIYNQRKQHKLKGWQGFCEFCDELPEFNYLTGCKRNNK
tara:strand:+ start:690 stop:1247 length:558 start_codon:yes stop_codon:yes gene_type:complete